VRSRRALFALSALLLALLGAVLAPAERPFAIKGDEATYVSMALSLAYDQDLRYTPIDLHRFEEMFGKGPVGIFLQKTKPPASPGLAFGKPFVYSVVAAPFVRAAGLRGLLFLNLLLLEAIVWMAWMFAATRMASRAAFLLAIAFVFASILGLYAVWRTPEVLNAALVFGGYFFWLYKCVAPERVAARHRWLVHPATDWVAAALLGLATFSKPPNALLIVPFVVSLLAGRRWRRAVIVAIAFLAFSAGAFGVNWLIAGETNYQGGDRRTFNDHFPFSDRSTAFDQGWPMVTENSDARTLLAPSAFWPVFVRNVGYFLVGRDAGLLPYFFPGAAILIAWLARPRAWRLWQGLAALALGVSVIVLLAFAPDTWNGGGGPPGNRYFLSLYPVLFFLLPAGASRGIAAVALLGFAVTAPLLAHPISSSLEPWHNVEHGIPRLLPIELTLADNLPVRLDLQRSRLDLDGALLYEMDENAFLPEQTKRFWVAGAARAEMILRTDRPIEKATLNLHSVVANHVSVTLGRANAEIDLQADGSGTLVFDPGPGAAYNGGSRAYVFTVTTTNGFVPAEADPKSPDRRFLGVFIEPHFVLNP
jgi:hypothetical protein